MVKFLSALVGTLLCWNVTAQGAVVTFSFTAPGDLGGTLSGEFSYDTSRPDLDPLSKYGAYDSARLRGVVVGGPLNGMTPGGLFSTFAFTANNDPGAGSDVVSLGLLDEEITLVLSDPTGTALSSDDLPSGSRTWDLAGSVAFVRWTPPGVPGPTHASFRLTSLSLSVPEPSTLALVIVGLVGLAATRRHGLIQASVP